MTRPVYNQFVTTLRALGYCNSDGTEFKYTGVVIGALHNGTDTITLTIKKKPGFIGDKFVADKITNFIKSSIDKYSPKS